jgi:hypothetical protein
MRFGFGKTREFSMGAKHNAHKVFYGAPDAPDFGTASHIDDKRIETLRETRDLARAAIAEGFGEWGHFVKASVVFDMSFVRRSVQLPTLKPKFRGQGSYKYRTMNEPAHQPPQQVDFDDGVFLPTSYIRLQGMTRPASPVVTSDGYFQLVEAILTPLCADNGWKLDSSKPSCVRIVIDDSNHLDFALYAVPDEQFVRMSAQAAATMDSALAKSQEAQLRINEQVYRDLDPAQIMLAHRTEGWKPSDPRELEKWFQDAVGTHGEQLRRICRYLKAWRDFNWIEGCKLSSITLMACAVEAFDAVNGTISDKRDDTALLIVARKLPELFGRPEGIKNPVLPELVLNDNWDKDCRDAYIAAANNLIKRVSAAIENAESRADTLNQLEDVFGSRIPDDVNLVVVEASAELTVKQYPAAKVPAPSVSRTTSG